MKIKKIARLVLTAIFAGTLFAGCGGGQENTSAPPPAKEKKLGMIAYMNSNEQQYNEVLQKVEEKSGIKFSQQVTFYDDLNSMEMGLESKSIDEMSVYTNVGKYITAKEPKMELVKDMPLKFTDSFCCAVRAEDTDLKNSIDAAITSMKDDGTLESLTKKYITDLKSDPPTVEIEKIDGADTVKVGVTGDLPPLDLVLADGKPAGFNTAVLSEIGKRIHKNIELVQINSAARAAALTSKKIDVVFWAVKPVGDSIPADVDKPAGIDLTSPYYQDDVVHIELKK